MTTEAAALRSRAEYLARIHRVMDHVERHLSEPLPLGQLASIACFSPYHFHRLFTAIAGEPLYQFVHTSTWWSSGSPSGRSEASRTALANDPG